MPLTEYDGDEDDDDEVDDDDEDDDDDHNGTVQCTRACASAWCLGFRRRSGRASGGFGGRHYHHQCQFQCAAPPVPAKLAHRHQLEAEVEACHIERGNMLRQERSNLISDEPHPIVKDVVHHTNPPKKAHFERVHHSRVETL